MSFTILVIDDEPDIRELLKYNLEREGYVVLTAKNGVDGLQLATSGIHLVILDVMMPKMDGWEVCRQLRRNPETLNVPVIFLTARDSEVDEVVGLELGAEDFLTKPVKIRTLLTRVRKVLQRTGEPLVARRDETAIHLGDLVIVPHSYSITLKGSEIPLPKKEFEILLFLARHLDQVVTRESLLNHIWGHDVVVVDRTIDVHVRKIRQKLDRYAPMIETVKGVGYRLRSTT